MPFEHEPIPDEVEIRDEARKPETEPDPGIPIAAAAGGTPKHRLVAIGDSLTQGFQSLAIYNTDLSYPALIARELGWYDKFRHPHYPGYGGIPLNLEVLIDELEIHFGDKLSWWELPSALYRVRQHLAEAENWWERGPGSITPPATGINHNLAIYGWDLRDVLERTAETADARSHLPDDVPFVPLVSNADKIAAVRALNSAVDGAGNALTPLQAAAALGDEGVEEGPDDQGDRGDGIETLIVLLGANNALGTVLSLEARWSGPDYADLREKGKYTVWRPSHFKAELDLVTAEVKKIRARHVIWGTVPHVTIAPVARGVGGKVKVGSAYFTYYTKPWIEDRAFDPKDDPHLTAAEAQAIDSAIDQYNDDIVGTVRQARSEGRDWLLLDLCGLLDRLAARRYIEDKNVVKPAWWTEYPLPEALARLEPKPDTRFFASGASGRTRGGLFSLDGTHATTIAYGLMAQEFINVMTKAGVVFYNNAGDPRDPVEIDFDKLIKLDSLISRPPRSISSDMSLIGWFDQRFDVLKRVWAGG